MSLISIQNRIIGIADNGLNTALEMRTLLDEIALEYAPYSGATKNIYSDFLLHSNVDNTTISGAVGTVLVTKDYLLGATSGATTTKAQISLSSAQILALNTTPIEIIPAQGVGTIIKVIDVTVKYTHVTTSYSTADDLRIKYSGGDATNVMYSMLTLWNVGANQLRGGSPIPDVKILENTGIVATTNLLDPTLGDGIAVVYVTYTVLTL
jgi:hypothetical protein